LAHTALTADASVLTDYQVYQTPYISITSPTPDSYVSTGNLTINGISSDNATSDCMVYVGWNGSSPYQIASANGTGGLEDYSTWNYTFYPASANGTGGLDNSSTWNYTYTPISHEIENGTNQLSSVLYCSGAGPVNSIAHSINVTGALNGNLSNITGTEYYYQDNSSGLFSDTGTGSSLGYDDGLGYDSSGITYDTANDSALDSSGSYDFDDYFNDVSNSGSSSSSDDDTEDDDSSDNVDDGSGTGTGNGTVTTPVGSFPVLNDGVFNIGAAGDWGSGTGAGKTALNMHEKGVDLAIGLGDYAYETGSENVRKWWNTQMAPLNGRFNGALGNHDTQDGSLYAQLFNQPEKWYYSFARQGVHFVAINSEESYGPGSAQYEFLDQDLQSASENSDVNWIVVFVHEPMYSSPSHHDPLASLRDAYHPLFDKYDVDLVLQGHNHNYQRSFPIMYNSQDPSKPIAFPDNDNGVFKDPPGQIYAEVGTAGKSKYSLEGKSPFIAEQFDTDVGFLNVAFPDDDTMEATFYDNTGNVKDEFSIEKTGDNQPVAVNDLASTEEDMPVSIEVLTNDKNQYGIAAVPTLPNPNLEVQIALVGNGPLHGTAQVSNNNSSRNENVITYTPSTDYYGTDSFTYTISPATGIGPKSPPTKVTVSVDPINDPPVANNDNATYDQNSGGGTINVLANDIDPDGDSLEVTEISDISETTLLNQSSIVNNLDGTISYTPASNFSGVDSFSYTISDGSNATASATVQVTVNPTNGQLPPLDPNTNVTGSNNTNTNVTNTNTTIPSTNATEIPLGHEGNNANPTNTNGTLVQPDTSVESNISETGNENTVVLNNNNNTTNSNDGNNNITSGPDANIILNAAIENLKNNALWESQKGNDTGSAGAASELDQSYDQTIARETVNQIARDAAIKAEQTLHSGSNDGDSPPINTNSNLSANVATDDDKVSITNGNNNGLESEVSGKTTTLSGTTVPSDPRIELNLAKEQIRQDLVEQVQSELARAQESMDDKSEASVIKTQASSSTAIDDSESAKTSVKPTESNTEIGDDNGNEGHDSDQTKTAVKSTGSQEEKQDSDSNAKQQQDTKSRQESSKPNANAGHKQGVKEGSKVVLDGTNSNDKDGDKMSYSWKQIQGPKVKLAHDDDAVGSFEAPNVPSGKSQLELQFSLTVTDGESTDKDTVSVSVRQDGSQDSKVDDEKARQSAANDNQKSSDGKAGRDQDQDNFKSSKKLDGNDQKSEKSSDDNAKQDESKKSEDKSNSQDDNNSDEKKSDESKDKEEKSSSGDGDDSDNSSNDKENDGAS
jgi:Big-like domain-containing protein/K319-like protein/calcineurin-like phosphoesterase family protein